MPGNSRKLGSYPLSSYDQYFCLKPSLLLWCTMLFLCRAIALPLLAQLSQITGAGGDLVSLVSGVFNVMAVLAAFPAFLVAVALLTRSPARGGFARALVAYGRLLLALSALGDLGLSLSEVLLGHRDFSDQSVGNLVAEVLDVSACAFIAASRRVRDVFAAYPEPEPTDASANKSR